MNINKTTSKSGLFYRGVCTVLDDAGLVVDQKTSAHERLSKNEALQDASNMESYYNKFSHFA